MWYVRNTGDRIETLALVPASNGFAVVQSPTGNYLAGHGESVLKKQAELTRSGYLEVEAARAQGIVAPDWPLPQLRESSYDFLALMRIAVPPEHQRVPHAQRRHESATLREFLRRLFGLRP